MTVGGMQVLPSVDTGGRNAVVRQVRRCAAVQTPVNCHCQLEKHPVGDVEPVKFVIKYLTQAAVNFQVPVTTRAAAFSARCNLSLTVLGAPARTVLQ